MDFTQDYKYKATFYSSASVVVPEDCNEFFAKASIDSLGGLLPEGVNPHNNPDLFYFAANGAVAGMCNLNGDAIYNETALQVYLKTLYKYINMEHKKETVVGVILYPGISEFGSSQLITVEKAKESTIFNLCLGGVVWRPIKKELVQALIESNDPSSPNFGRISLSWEIFFNDYDIAVGSKIVKEARILTSDEDIAKYSPLLKQNGGDGICDEGHVYRVIKNTNGEENPNVIIAGYSFVTDPAAAVKGVLPLDNSNKSAASESSDAQKNEELEASKLQNTKELAKILEDIKNIYTFISHSKNNSVTTNITKVNTMDITLKSVDDIASNWEAITKLEASAGVNTVIKLFRDELVKASEEYTQKLNAEKQLADQAKADLEKAIADTKELNVKFEETNKKLQEIQDLEAARASQELFNERMAGFDAEYDLDDEDRKVLVSKLTNLDEAGFASFQKEFSVFAKEKNKKWKETNKKELENKEKEKKEAAASQKTAEELAKEALASATTDKVPLSPGLDPAKDLFAKMTETFAKGVKIRGQK